MSNIYDFKLLRQTAVEEKIGIVSGEYGQKKKKKKSSNILSVGNTRQPLTSDVYSNTNVVYTIINNSENALKI